MFPQAVERLRPLVPLSVPASLVLATIRAESAGKIGARAGRGTASAHDPSCGLDPSLVHKCLGLGQIAGVTLETYNDNNPSERVTACQLAGDTWPDAAAQVKVAAWLVGWCLRKVHLADPVLAPWPIGELTREQALQSDLIYSRGPGAWREKREAIVSDGEIATFDAMKARFPAWGAPYETPFRHAERVVNWAWDDFGDPGSDPGSDPGPDPEPVPEPVPEPPVDLVAEAEAGSLPLPWFLGGLALLAVALALVAYAMNADPFTDLV